VSSRLFECEVCNRINAHLLQHSHGDAVRHLIGRVAMIGMVGPVLTQFASYDERLPAAARLLGIAEWSERQ
jgi:hypothetical protein